MKYSINPFLFAAILTALGGCISMNRHITSPSVDQPSLRPSISFAEIDTNNDGNVTRKEIEEYNKIEGTSNLKYNEPTTTFSYIMFAVIVLCAGSMVYELFKVKKEGKKKI